MLHVQLTVLYTVSFTCICSIHLLNSTAFIFQQFMSNTFSRFVFAVVNILFYYFQPNCLTHVIEAYF